MAEREDRRVQVPTHVKNRIPVEVRNRAIQLLAQGEDPAGIAEGLRLSKRQLSAIAAHVTIGTYRVGDRNCSSDSRNGLSANERGSTSGSQILLGSQVGVGEHVYWNPNPPSGTQNPHVFILGESGSGKTYCIACLLAELANKGLHSIVLDYAQGFGKG